ncbi:MAG: GTPase Era, partial [Clostridia bacterium]|nr:GTPase Era [Clostridia bacterium]
MKSGFVSIIGRPNAGKSTLLNALNGEKLAVVSDKPQTTRNTITAILTDKDKQIVFLDTPGLHKPKTKLGEFMVKEAESSITAVDLVLFVIEPGHDFDNEAIIENIKNIDEPVILIINKIDSFEKENLLEIIAKYSEKMNFAEIIPVSAKKGDGVKLVMDAIVSRLEEGPMYFPDDMITDQPEKQIASEMIREKALWCLDKEVPHGIAVEISSFKENEKGILEIGATIYCEKQSHKGIIIGKNGAMLK